MEESECQCEHDGEVKEVRSDIDYFSWPILISGYGHILEFRVRFLLLTPSFSPATKKSFLSLRFNCILNLDWLKLGR